MITNRIITSFSLTALLSLLFFIYSYSQSNEDGISVKVGPMFRMDERSIPLNIIGSDSIGYYILYGGGKFGQKDKSIRRFNLDFNPTDKVINLIPAEMSDSVRIIDIIQIDNKIQQLLAHTTRDATEYYLQRINLKDFSLEPRKFITELDKKRILCVFFMSKDTTILFHTIPNKNTDRQKIRVTVFDNNFDEIEVYDYEFPYSNKQFQIQQIMVNNKHEIILLARVFNSNMVGEELYNKGYEYIIYNLCDGRFNEIAIIKTRGKHMRQFIFFENEDNELVFAGFYSEQDMYSIKGTFYYRINPETKEIVKYKMQELGMSFFTKLLTGTKKNRAIKRIEKGIFEDKYFVLLYYNYDDELLLIAEQQYINQNKFINYHHENIALIKLDQNGEIIWSTKIGKDNSERKFGYPALKGGPVYGSFITCKRDDQLFLLYNGNTQNLNHSMGPVINAFEEEGQAFISTKISSNGDYKRSILLTDKQLDGFRIRPSLSRWSDEHSIIFFGQDPNNVKNQRFIKVNLNLYQITDAE